MSALVQIQEAVERRVEEIAASNPVWPCRKGCDDCCRSLASPPQVSRAEWDLIAAAVSSLPVEVAEEIRRRIRAGASASRPVVCPLLDLDSGSCLVYEARPIACRAYGLYAERDLVLGCGRIEAIARESAPVVWGNHVELEQRVRSLGDAASLAEWAEVLTDPPQCVIIHSSE